MCAGALLYQNRFLCHAAAMWNCQYDDKIITLYKLQVFSCNLSMYDFVKPVHLSILLL